MSAKQVSYKGPVCKEREEYEKFIIQFDQYAHDNDVFEYIQAEKHRDLPAEEDVDLDALADQAERKKVRDALFKNKVGVGYWTHALNNIALLNMVQRSKTAEWPSGQAWVIRKSLDKALNPKDMPARAKMLSELGKIELKTGQDPN